MKKLLSVLLTLYTLYFILHTPVSARITPEDILNAKKDEYNQRVKNYSPQTKQKLETFSKKIADLNKSETDLLEQNMIRQGEILDEYLRRKGYNAPPETDGKTRDLSQPIENARYWLTYAHEAVAYQAAKVYVFNLTGEKNASTDILNTLSLLQSDMNILVGKVDKSQKIIAGLVAK